MADYINRELLLNDLETSIVVSGRPEVAPLELRGVHKVINRIKAMPTADVQEVKHGHWEDKFNRNRMATQTFCSVCGKHSGIGGIDSNRHKPYCPLCGARMDGGNK